MPWNPVDLYLLNFIRWVTVFTRLLLFYKYLNVVYVYDSYDAIEWFWRFAPTLKTPTVRIVHGCMCCLVVP